MPSTNSPGSWRRGSRLKKSPLRERRMARHRRPMRFLSRPGSASTNNRSGCPLPHRQPAAAPPPLAAAAPSPVGQANAEELGAILDTMAEGVVLFDETGRISTCNRSAEALFGYDGDDFTRRNLTDLFAPESQRVL